MAIPSNKSIRRVTYNSVNIPLVGPTLQSKTATPSLTSVAVTPDSGYDGLSTVTVNPVTGTLLHNLDSDFVAGNIKKDVNLFGLIGTLESSGLIGVHFGTITPTETTKILDFSSVSTTFDSCVILCKDTSNNPAYKICSVTVSNEYSTLYSGNIVYLPSAGASNRSVVRDGVSISSGVLTVTAANPNFVSGQRLFYMLWNSTNSPFMK